MTVHLSSLSLRLRSKVSILRKQLVSNNVIGMNSYLDYLSSTSQTLFDTDPDDINTLNIEEKKNKAFAGRMLAVLNSGFLAVMCEIGHRTKLFEVAALMDRPMTSEELAMSASLSERHVREWLGAMVIGKVFTYDPINKTYYLPKQHAAR